MSKKFLGIDDRILTIPVYGEELLLKKAEKTIRVKATSKRVAHKRKIHFEGKKEDKKIPFSNIKECSNTIEFMRQNIDELKKYGIKDKESSDNLFNKLRLERFNFTKMSKESAISTIRDNIREGVHSGWFRNEDKGMKTPLFNSIVNNDETRSAGLKIMYDIYKIQKDSDISFDDFLNTEISLYRGGKVTGDIFTSFSLNKKTAEKFAKQYKCDVMEIKIKPIQTLGSYQTIEEAEILVPDEMLKNKKIVTLTKGEKSIRVKAISLVKLV